MSNIHLIKKEIGSVKSKFEAINTPLEFIKEAGFAIRILEANDYLQKMEMKSIRDSVINVAMIGLTLNPALKYCYLIPRKGKCTLDISYMGMIKLLTDLGGVRNVTASIVNENDEFAFKKGTDAYIHHIPNLKNPGNKYAVYAIAHFSTGGSQFEIMTRPEIEKVRNKSESWQNEEKRQYSPWQTWEEEMWKKTVIKRLFKVLPKKQMSDNLLAALASEERNEVEDIAGEEKNHKYSKIFEEAEYEEVEQTEKKAPEPDKSEQSKLNLDEPK
jgi:recombination protein RecT